MPRKKTVARKSVKKVFKNCPICNQKMDLYVTSHRSTPFVDNNNYPKMCFGCYNVPRTQRQKYKEEGYIIEDAILEYSMKNLNTAKDAAVGMGANSSALICAGGKIASPPAATGKTEEWNGINWTETSDMNTARNNLAASGSTTAGVVFGGGVPPFSAATEEWSSTSNTIKVLTD